MQGVHVRITLNAVPVPVRGGLAWIRLLLTVVLRAFLVVMEICVMETLYAVPVRVRRLWFVILWVIRVVVMVPVVRVLFVGVLACVR